MKTDSAPNSPCPSPSPEGMLAKLQAEDKEGGRGHEAGDGENARESYQWCRRRCVGVPVFSVDFLDFRRTLRPKIASVYAKALPFYFTPPPYCTTTQVKAIRTQSAPSQLAASNHPPLPPPAPNGMHMHTH